MTGRQSHSANRSETETKPEIPSGSKPEMDLGKHPERRPSDRAPIVYVGTYTAPNIAPGSTAPSTAEGIYVYKMESDATFSAIQVVPAKNPSFVTVNSAHSRLYCVNELGEDESGNPLGSVSSYAIDPKTGKLNFLNAQPTHGTWPCHCSIHPSGTSLLAANYGTGSFVVFPIHDDGSLGDALDRVSGPGNGAGADGARQSGPHAHMICANPSAQRVFGVDMGADSVFIRKLDQVTGKLVPAEIPSASVASGCGPRHMAFHPDEKYAFVLNELSSTIDVFSFDATVGSLVWFQTISTLPENTKLVRPDFDPNNPGAIAEGGNTGAGLLVHPSGNWVYATNRGMNSVVRFGVDPASGKLTEPQWMPSGGQIPRGLGIDATGTYLIVGNQSSDLAVVFTINPTNGALDGPRQELHTPTPVDFAFGPLV